MMNEKQCQRHLTGIGMAWLFFGLEKDRCFHRWLMHLVPGSQCKHQDLYPLTIWSKNLSPSLSYCSRCSMQTPIKVAFFSSFQLFSTHNAETSITPELAWRCDAHIRHWCQGVTQWSTCTIWSYLACVSGSKTWSQRLGHAKSSVLFLPSLNLFYQSSTAVHCEESSSIHILLSKMNACCLAPSVHRNWMMQCCAWLDKFVTVLHCADITQSSLLMTYLHSGQ